jgi:hypothetical protein
MGPTGVPFGVEILKCNYIEKLPLVIDSIKESLFVAIDTELTGGSECEFR